MHPKPSGLSFEVPRVREGRFTVHAENGTVFIDMFDAVGGEQVNEGAVAAALLAAGALPVTVRINSPGGDFYAGLAIYNLLRGHRPGVTVHVLGIAASAASLIAMAGSRIEIARVAEIMVHKAWTIAIGNEDVMDQARTFLRQVDSHMVDIYARRTGQSPEKVRALMAAETFMSSEQAIALGFADAVMRQDAEASLEHMPSPADVRALAATLRHVAERNSSVRRETEAEAAHLAACVERAAAELRMINERKAA
jgi:ATP-dependent Clp protease protease subunit